MLKFVGNITNTTIIQRLLLHLHRNPHILYYHSVRKDKPDYYYQDPITPDTFRAQLKWLLKNKFEFVSLNEINDGGGKGRRVALTTDDGFVENYTCIAPILADYKIPATFFILNNCIDNKDLMWMNKLFAIEHVMGANHTKQQVYNILRDRKKLSHDLQNLKSVYREIPMKQKEEIVNEVWSSNNLPALSEYMDQYKPYMSSKQINELLASGYTIGSHTRSHPRCAQLTFSELETEIIDSMDELRKSFKTSIDFFAYPFGSRPDPVVEEKIFRLSRARAFLGTKNSDLKLDGSLVWERDKMEQSKSKSLFWFSAVPLIRKFFLRPIGIYK